MSQSPLHPESSDALSPRDRLAALPILQGGMGVGVSDWRLARAVALRGPLGVVSGTGLESVLARRLQDGDRDGAMRRAMAAFPIPGTADALIRRFFRPGGRPPGVPYRNLPPLRAVPGKERERQLMLAAFVEVWLAKEGHDGLIGMNLLTKIQIPTLASLYGAMLAGVDCVLMGAGIPDEIPAALSALAGHEPCSLRFEVEGLPTGVSPRLEFTPRAHWPDEPPPLRRPCFVPIVASHSLAAILARKAAGGIDGFVIEGPTAGGHNAPPRGPRCRNERGEPVYGERDVVDLARIRELGLPFWLAGGTGRSGSLAAARQAGAAGIQVGTLFAYCDESGLAEDLKRSILEHAARGEVRVRTDARASPTGFPFKVVEWPGDPGAGAERERICDMGYLRRAYWDPGGGIRYRCPAEPVADHLRKGGRVEDTEGRMCLCNALLANIGLGQVRAGGRVEPPLVTSGDDLESIGGFLAGRTQYSAAAVVQYLEA